MDPAQGETGGKSLTSKLKSKVKGVKSKVHRPGHKKQPGAGGDYSSSSDYSSDDSSQKPGPETGYNVGDSTPFTTVKQTPLTPDHSPPRDSHSRDYTPSENVYSSDHPDRTGQQQYPTSTIQGAGGYNEPYSSTTTKPAPGVVGKVKQTVGGAAAVVGSKVGFYHDMDVPITDPNAPTMTEKAKAALGLNKPADPYAPTMAEKAKAALGMNKPVDPYAPTMAEKAKAALGLNKPADPYAPTMAEKAKAALGMNKPVDPYAPTMTEKARNAVGMNQPTDPYAPTMAEKAKNALGMNQPTDPYAPTMAEKAKNAVGMNQPTDPYAPTMAEKAKNALGMNQPTDPYAPTMMEKAKNAVGMNQPADPYAPTMAEKAKNAVGLNNSAGPYSSTTPTGTRTIPLGHHPQHLAQHQLPEQQQQPGIVNRVSGAVGSVFGGSPANTGADVQHTYPAHSDDYRTTGERGVPGVPSSANPNYY